MIEVKIKNSEDAVEFDKMVKLFIKLVNKEGILQYLRDNRYYMKPSEAKRLQAKQTHRRKK